MPRERHQKGWIVVSGKTEKKWIGHWMPMACGRHAYP